MTSSGLISNRFHFRPLTTTNIRARKLESGEGMEILAFVHFLQMESWQNGKGFKRGRDLKCAFANKESFLRSSLEKFKVMKCWRAGKIGIESEINVTFGQRDICWEGLRISRAETFQVITVRIGRYIVASYETVVTLLTQRLRNCSLQSWVVSTMLIKVIENEGHKNHNHVCISMWRFNIFVIDIEIEACFFLCHKLRLVCPHSHDDGPAFIFARIQGKAQLCSFKSVFRRQLTPYSQTDTNWQMFVCPDTGKEFGSLV